MSCAVPEEKRCHPECNWNTRRSPEGRTIFSIMPSSPKWPASCPRLPSGLRRKTGNHGVALISTAKTESLVEISPSGLWWTVVPGTARPLQSSPRFSWRSMEQVHSEITYSACGCCNTRRLRRGSNHYMLRVVLWIRLKAILRANRHL